MVEYSENQLDAVFQALADATRRGMLAHLGEGAHTVSSLAEPYDMSLAAASKHIKKLEAAGLVEREVVGRVHHCRLSPNALKYASDWLRDYERFWNARLDVLEGLLKAEDDTDRNKGG
ncbi:ArsR/SmtB family transcription factor [Kordiimonas aquimaris]|uniref:ArsR/SmtB family transcription factor n=1 Tax=Kordiimonas aquimaris TaxID=707591 RepID=UPI0021D26D66|nr:metalloregulator ArsR/SmtB family transcription factor [Kordiimonas aquimaris]